MVGEYQNTGTPFPAHSQVKYPYRERDPDSSKAFLTYVRSASKAAVRGDEPPGVPEVAADMGVMTMARQATAVHPLSFPPDHTANHKIPAALAHSALAEVIAVLRFPQACPGILIKNSLRISCHYSMHSIALLPQHITDAGF